MHLFKIEQVNFYQLCNHHSLLRRESKQFGKCLLPAKFIPYDFRFSFQVALKYNNFFYFGDDSFKKKRTKKDI